MNILVTILLPQVLQIGVAPHHGQGDQGHAAGVTHIIIPLIIILGPLAVPPAIHQIITAPVMIIHIQITMLVLLFILLKCHRNIIAFL